MAESESKGGWWKPYNVSGTIHCGDRHGELISVVGEILGTEEMAIIGYSTGATTVGGKTDRARFQATGIDVLEFYAEVSGEHAQWLAFGRELEERLTLAEFPCSITVHNETINRASPQPKQGA